MIFLISLALAMQAHPTDDQQADAIDRAADRIEQRAKTVVDSDDNAFLASTFVVSDPSQRATMARIKAEGRYNETWVTVGTGNSKAVQMRVRDIQSITGVGSVSTKLLVKSGVNLIITSTTKLDCSKNLRAMEGKKLEPVTPNSLGEDELKTACKIGDQFRIDRGLRSASPSVTRP